MNIAVRFPDLHDADAALFDVARRIQITKSKHDEADEHFAACAST